jgi:hypothetical protein
MATTRYRRPRASKEGNQLRSALAVHPWSRSSVGAPGGPATSRTNVVPRPFSTTSRPGGNRGVQEEDPVGDDRVVVAISA